MGCGIGITTGCTSPPPSIYEEIADAAQHHVSTHTRTLPLAAPPASLGPRNNPMNTGRQPVRVCKGENHM